MGECRRILLHEKLMEILGSGHVYFQPPASVKMEYPCIRYKYSSISTIWCNNLPYRLYQRYEMIFISRNTDEEIVEALASLPMCTLDRCYTANNLYHSAYTLYF